MSGLPSNAAPGGNSGRGGQGGGRGRGRGRGGRDGSFRSEHINARFNEQLLNHTARWINHGPSTLAANHASSRGNGNSGFDVFPTYDEILDYDDYKFGSSLQHTNRQFKSTLPLSSESETANASGPSNASEAAGQSAEPSRRSQRRRRKQDARRRQAEEALGTTQQPPGEDAAMGNSNRGTTATATANASSGEDPTLKAIANSMAQFEQQMQQNQEQFEKQMKKMQEQLQQQLSTTQASAEPVVPARGNLARSECGPLGVMQLDRQNLDIPGNDQNTTATPEPPVNAHVPEGSRDTRCSSHLARDPPEDRTFFDGVPAGQWQPPPGPESTAIPAPSTGQSTVEGQTVFTAAAVPNASILGGALPDNARSQPATRLSVTALSRSLTADEQEQLAFVSRKLAGTKNPMKLM